MRVIRRFAVLLMILICFQTIGVSGSSEDQTLDRGAVDRLAGLCRLWGTVKFCHPYLAHKDIDWDEALISILPKVRSSENPREYRAALQELLSFLDDRATYVMDELDSQSPPENVEKAGESAVEEQPFVKVLEDGTAVVTATDYSQFDGRNIPWNEMYMRFSKAFTEAAGSEKVILDFRGLKQGGPSWLLGITLTRTFGMLLKDALPLPPTRFIKHRGYASQKESSSAYHSELCVRSGGRVPGMSKPDCKASRFVVLINGESADFTSIWTAMQEKGLAVVVFEGPLPKNLGNSFMRVPVASGLTGIVRTSEMLRNDGGNTFQPDLIVDSGALDAGLDILSGKRTLERPDNPEASKPEKPHLFSTAEKDYVEMSAPDWNYRMLSLFRFWNVVHNFFPYKDLMDKPWDDVLLEFIPRFSEAEGERAYVAAVAELSTRLQDSHVTVNHPLLSEMRGMFGPDIRVDQIEGETVVTGIGDPEIIKQGLAEGDVVLSIDGKTTAERRSFLTRLIAASTPGRLSDLTDMFVLRGNKDSICTLKVKKENGEELTVRTVRASGQMPPRAKPTDLPVHTVLPSGFGYVDLGRLMGRDAAQALETIKDTPGLVLDMRGYPVGGANVLGAMLCRERAARALFHFIEFDGANAFFSLDEEFQYIEPMPDGPFPYEGKIAVLIGNSSQSAAEHTCLMLEAIADVTFIGSPTSGANGNITHTVLPGGIIVSFTGMDVRHADGRQLQRKGIIPHIPVAPTIQGVLSGRDEVLEKAVRFLEEKTASRF